MELAYNFIEGELPTDAEVTAALMAAGKPVSYQNDDFFSEEELAATPSVFLDKISSDTCQWLLTFIIGIYGIILSIWKCSVRL